MTVIIIIIIMNHAAIEVKPAVTAGNIFRSTVYMIKTVFVNSFNKQHVNNFMTASERMCLDVNSDN